MLAGDIDAATAKARVERYFGAIPSGPQVPPVVAPVPTLPKRVEQTMHDRVATTRIYRVWAVPGINDPEAVALDVGATVLGRSLQPRVSIMSWSARSRSRSR